MIVVALVLIAVVYCVIERVIESSAASELNLNQVDCSCVFLLQ